MIAKSILIIIRANQNAAIGSLSADRRLTKPPPQILTSSKRSIKGFTISKIGSKTLVNDVKNSIR